MATTQSKAPSVTNKGKMILRPADFSILDELQGGRNVGANLSDTLDVSRPYVTERLSQLADYGLVRRVGPNQNVGLYEITDLGRATLAHKDDYGEVDDFEGLIESKASEE